MKESIPVNNDTDIIFDYTEPVLSKTPRCKHACVSGPWPGNPGVLSVHTTPIAIVSSADREPNECSVVCLSCLLDVLNENNLL